MRNTAVRLSVRSVRSSKGRWLALLLIVMLSVGFFAGLKGCRDQMWMACQNYLKDQNFYDYRMYSSLGFTSDEVDAIRDQLTSDGIGLQSLEGMKSFDAVGAYEDEKGTAQRGVYLLMSMPEEVNLPSLVSGRMPEADDECVVDDRALGSGAIGSTITFSDSDSADDTTETIKSASADDTSETINSASADHSSETTISDSTDSSSEAVSSDSADEEINTEANDVSSLKNVTYTIVGTVNSPLYLNDDRGSSDIGSGEITGFVCLPADNFTSSRFTEIDMTLNDTEDQAVYSDAYSDTVDASLDDVKSALSSAASDDYENILQDIMDEADRKAQEALDEAKAKAAEQIAAAKEAAAQAQQAAAQGMSAEQIAAAQASAQGMSAEQIAAAQQSGETQGISAEQQAALQQAEAQQEALNNMEITPMTRDQAAEEASKQGIDEPSTYVLKRSENNGYASFKNDTSIINGIVNVFPVFFILIALLVCITTMTRMVEEERTQIGTLKALGCSDFSITMKYMLYAGSAAVIGWAVGFFAGTWGLPKVFWWAYRVLYDFAPLPYVFSLPMALFTLSVSLAAVVLSIWISCRGELLSTPAVLIRPKSAKPGKRIWLERIPQLWKRLPFLRKVTLRNMFRYKMRMIMMLIGVGSCTALVLTGFGVRDSMIHVGDIQFSDIQKYQLAVATDKGEAESSASAMEDLTGKIQVSEVLPCVSKYVDVSAGERIGSVTLLSFADGTDIRDFWNLTPVNGGEGQITLPEQENGAVVSKRLAEKLGLEKGDTFRIEESSAGNDDLVTAELTVEGVFENYISNYIFINEETCREIFEADASGNTQKSSVGSSDEAVSESDSSDGESEADFADMANECLVKTDGTPDKALLKKINRMDAVTGVTNLADTRADVRNSVSCLNYIIWLLVLFSGALSFIVIFNLTNINLAERSREIATVEVLGFYPKETRSYVLWENLFISILAGFIGLPGGWLFTRFVLGRVLLDNMTFPFIIHGISYLLALICTVVFAAVVNLFMRRSIARIHMAESLKAVE